MLACSVRAHRWYVKRDVQFDIPTLAAIHPHVLLKSNAATAFQESRKTISVAMLTAGHAEEAIAADASVEQ